MPYFGYSRYPMNVRTRSIIRLASSAFRFPSGRRPQALQQLLLLLPGLLPSLLEAPLASARLEVLDVAEDQGHQRAGRSLQRGLVMSISPTQRIPYLSSQPWMASARFPARPRRAASSARRARRWTAAAEKPRPSGCGRITSATSRQRQAHLRRDVVRDGLRERVGRVASHPATPAAGR